MDTPARNTRGRRSASRGNTPLPALPTQESHAYGAEGRATLRQQITDDGPGLASAFQNSRRAPAHAANAATSLPPQEEVPTTQDSPVKPRAGGSRKGRKVAELRDITETDELDMPPPAAPRTRKAPLVQERSVTSIPAPGQYQQRENAPPFQEPPADTQPITSAMHPPLSRLERPSGQAKAPVGEERQSPIAARIFWRTLPKWTRGVLNWYRSSAVKILSFILILFALFILARSTSRYYKPSFDVYVQLPGPIQQHIFGNTPVGTIARIEQLVRNDDEDFFNNRMPDHNIDEKQWSFNKWLDARVRYLEEDVDMLRGKIGLLNETTMALEHMLPRLLVVRTVDGKYEIPAEFWQALKERLTSGEGAGAWQSFIESNKASLKGLHVPQASGNHPKMESITSERFRELVEENNSWMTEKYTHVFRKMEKEVFKTTRSISADTAKELIARLPTSQVVTSQLQALAKANHLHNVNEAMRSVNYFSRGLGAVVDPHLTSPSKLKPQRNLLASLYTRMPWRPSPRSAMVALERWDEAGDCWCAAPSVNVPGKAQITVVMPTAIHPDALVVEHAPVTGTLDSASAPRELEVWAEVGSRIEAERIYKMISREPRHGSYWQCDETSPPTDRHVCIGSASYDISNTNWVQHFPMWMDSQQLGLLTSKMTIRVKANWGGDWTCLYRIRMTGTQSHTTTTAAAATAA